jgi:hypothetical protein
MGWIHDRYMKTGHGLSHGVQSERRSAPLKNIVAVISIGDNNLFGSGNYVELECGHNVFTHGEKKARCIYCKKEVNQ